MIKKTKGTNAETWNYTYDQDNHLITAKQSLTDGGSAQMQATYTYDALRNRLEKDVWTSQSGLTTVTRFAYDDGNVWADLNGSSSLTNRRIYLDGTDQAAAHFAGGAVAWCLQDGGDVGPPAGLDRDGHLQGLGPTDSVAEYTDSAGRRRLAVSNRVCICVPRFAVLRTETPPARYASSVALAEAQTVQGQAELQMRLPSRQAEQYEQLGTMRNRLRPSGTVSRLGTDQLLHVEVLHGYEMNIGPATLLGTDQVQQLTTVQRTELLRQFELARQFSQVQGTRGVQGVEGTAVVGRAEGLQVVSTVVEAHALTVAHDHEVMQSPDKPLYLFKWASAQSAQVGDVITFHLKYSNRGGQPITDVAVSDSLTGRLEYVAGSARSDRDAVFTTQANEAGSLILRWEIDGRLLPGQSGVVSFQARVR